MFESLRKKVIFSFVLLTFFSVSPTPLFNAHEEVTKLTEPINLVFIDADKDGYVDYLNKLLPLVRPGGLVVAHNMRVPPPDPQYVNAVTTNPELETVFLNMHSAGIGVTLKKR
jgi:caffeoyl-CoA O-methyltransferase